MPRFNGSTACRYILAKDPAARVVLISGATSPTDLTGSGAIAILSKPITLDRLYAALYAAARPPSVPDENLES